MSASFFSGDRGAGTITLNVTAMISEETPLQLMKKRLLGMIPRG